MAGARKLVAQRHECRGKVQLGYRWLMDALISGHAKAQPLAGVAPGLPSAMIF